MKRIILPLALTSFFTLFLVAPLASAQFDPFGNTCVNQGTTTEACEACTGEAANSEVCQTASKKENPITGQYGVLVTVLNILSFIVGVASVLMVLLGGFKYITSNGDSNAISSAKNTVLYSIVGAVVFLFSQLIIRFVISRL